MKVKKLKKQQLILANAKVIIIESRMDVPTIYEGTFEDIPETLLSRKIDFISPQPFGETAIRIFVFGGEENDVIK